MSVWPLSFYPETMRRVCETPEKMERFRITSERFLTKYEPANLPERDLVKDMIRAYWLMNYWKRLSAEAKRELRVLEASGEQAERVVELKTLREHCQWHAIKQSLFLNRRKKLFGDQRVDRERELAQYGYTLAEEREIFLAGEQPGEEVAPAFEATEPFEPTEEFELMEAA